VAWGDEPPLVSHDDDLDAVARSQLGEDALDVRLDRGAFEGQRFGDLSVRESLGDELEDLPLACGEFGETWVGFAAEDRVCGDPFDQAPSDRG
jgi:hypothetical protein